MHHHSIGFAVIFVTYIPKQANSDMQFLIYKIYQNLSKIEFPIFWDGSGFFQMPITPDCQCFTALNSCYGTYTFIRLSMWLSSSPASFQLLMDKIPHSLTFRSCLCYLDDVLVLSEKFQQHISDITEVFQRLQGTGFFPMKVWPKMTPSLLLHQFLLEIFPVPRKSYNYYTVRTVPNSIWYEKPQKAKRLIKIVLLYISVHCQKCHIRCSNLL